MSEAGSIAMGGGGVAEEAVAIPVRYWWLKRIGVVAGTLVVLFGAMRWYWGVEAERRLQHEIARIQAAGEPIYPEDFDPPEPVPDEDNAALALMNAANAVTIPPEVKVTINELMKDPDLYGDRLDEVGRIISANEEPLRQIRDARMMKGIDWGDRIRSPAVESFSAPFSEPRTLSKLARVAAIYRHRMGEDARAVEEVRDIIRIGAIIERRPSGMISHLIGVACSSLAVQTIEEIAPSLHISRNADPPAGTTGPAHREQVLGLIGELLDEGDMGKGIELAITYERMFELDSALVVTEGEPGAPPPGVGVGVLAQMWAGRMTRFSLRPILTSDAVRMVRRCSAQLDGFRKRNYPAARKVSPGDPKPFRGFRLYTRPLSALLMPAFSGFVRLHFRGLTERRMAATGLAIRLYELDHGERPVSLLLLVPDYLPAVAMDPFAEDDREIGYLPGASKPILYSVGPDGIDDGGEYGLGGSGGVDWDAKDIPFFLDGDRPRMERKKEPTTSSPVEGDEDVGG